MSVAVVSGGTSGNGRGGERARAKSSSMLSGTKNYLAIYFLVEKVYVAFHQSALKRTHIVQATISLIHRHTAIPIVTPLRPIFSPF